MNFEQKSVNIVRGVALVALSSLLACAGDTSDAGQESGQESAAKTSAQTAALVASIDLENDHAVEFYDFGRGVLIAERGQSYSTPVLDEVAKRGDTLSAVWSKLAPNRPVPEALFKLQDRLKKLPRYNQDAPLEQLTVDEVADEEIFSEAEPSHGIYDKASCNNGCCDASWLRSDFAECQGKWDKSWFHFNAPGSTANIKDEITDFRYMVCSATGTSRFRFSAGSKSRDVPVEEGRFIRGSWYAGDAFIGYYGEPLKSSVTVAGSGRATYCGMVYLD